MIEQSILSGEVTGCPVIPLFFFQWRNYLATDLLCFPTTWMEIAAGRWVHRAWHVPFKDDAFAPGLFLRIRNWNGRK